MAKIKMFVCGPTVYDYIHIGNARTFVFFDVLAKWLKSQGNDLEYIQNITDIEDKIIARAKEQGRDPLDYAREYEQKFYEDMAALGVTSPTYKRATDHILEVISQVKRLITSGHVYEIDNSGYYFDLKSFPEYGKLSGRTTEMADDAVSRIDENPNKRNKGDFCVWKGDFQTGRPGWHIEDTAITEKYFGPQYDIHGGGLDLMFPHHEAELALMESISGLKPFVQKWIHAGFLVNKQSKMSKSAGNFTTLHEALQKYPASTLRFYFLSAHYGAPLDYSDVLLASAQAATQRLGELALRFRGRTAGSDEAVRPLESMIAAMNDDYNVPKAFGALFDWVREMNKKPDDSVGAVLAWVQEIFGIIPEKLESIPPEVQKLIDERETARKAKNYETSDALRKEIENAGYQVDDTQYGPLVKKY